MFAIALTIRRPDRSVTSRGTHLDSMSEPCSRSDQGKRKRVALDHESRVPEDDMELEPAAASKKPKLDFIVEGRLVGELLFSQFTKDEGLASFIKTRAIFSAQFTKAWQHHGLSKNFFSKADKEFSKIKDSGDAEDLDYPVIKQTLVDADKECTEHVKKIGAWRQQSDCITSQIQAIRDLQKLSDAKAAFDECKRGLSQIKAETMANHIAEWRIVYNKILVHMTKFKTNSTNAALTNTVATDMQQVMDEAHAKPTATTQQHHSTAICTSRLHDS